MPLNHMYSPCCLQHSLRNSVVPKRLAFGTPEKKLLVVFFYFTVLCSLALVTLTLRTKYGSAYQQSVMDYFVCEIRGRIGGDNQCLEFKSDIRRYSFPVIGTIAFVVLGLYPIVTLLYVVNVKTLREVCSRKPSPGTFDTRRTLFNMTSKVSQMSFPQNTQEENMVSTKGYGETLDR